MVSGLVKLQAKEGARSSTKKSIEKHGPWFVVARDFVRDTKGHLGYYVFPANDVTNLLLQSMADKREGWETCLIYGQAFCVTTSANSSRVQPASRIGRLNCVDLFQQLTHN